MANYYPLIAKAVAGLKENTGQGRRKLYERARNALVTELRSLTSLLASRTSRWSGLRLKKRSVRWRLTRRAEPSPLAVAGDDAPEFAQSSMSNPSRLIDRNIERQKAVEQLGLAIMMPLPKSAANDLFAAVFKQSEPQ